MSESTSVLGNRLALCMVRTVSQRPINIFEIF